MFQYANRIRTVTEAWGDAYQLYRESFLKVLPMVFILTVITSLISLTQMTGADFSVKEATTLTPSETVDISVWSFLGILLNTLVSAILMAAILYRTNQIALQQDNGSMAALHVARKKLFTLIFAALMMFAFIMAGMLAFIAPGIFLSVLLIFYMPLIIFDDNTAWESIRNSAKLVWGDWWRTLLVVIMPVVIAVVITTLAGLLLGGTNLYAELMVNLFIMPFFVPFFNAVLLVQFRDLKLRKKANALAPTIRP